MKRGYAAVCAVLGLLSACRDSAGTSIAGTSPPISSVVNKSGVDTTGVPLNDLPPRTYLGFEGGLYPGGSNVLPATHASVGLQRAKLVTKLGTNGKANKQGKYVLLSIGMSNASDEFCQRDGTTACWTGSFMQQAAADAAVNHTDLVIVNGAIGGYTSTYWDSPTDFAYDTVKVKRLAPFGVTEAQVQVVWLKNANKEPTVSLPATNADAYAIEQAYGATIRAIKTRYPNVHEVFISSRVYAGYANVTLNPEPYAYENGLSVKWLIGAQINQMNGGGIDPLAGSLDYNTVAPLIAWGPYMWANGMNPRSDGLTWAIGDFKQDGTHLLETTGVPKVGGLLLTFFKTSPKTMCWFLKTGGVCS